MMRSQMIRFIDKNERDHIKDAKEKVKRNRILHKDGMTLNMKQHVMTEEEQLYNISEDIFEDRQKFTAMNRKMTNTVALTEDLILVGNSRGQVSMYDRKDEEAYAIFRPKGKAFEDNAVTAIAVHPVRPDYVIIGYQQGQIVLMDVTTTAQKADSSLKIIKDAHKGVPIANLSFCDLITAPKHDKQTKKKLASAIQKSMKKGKKDRGRSGEGELDIFQAPPEEAPITTVQKSNKEE